MGKVVTADLTNIYVDFFKNYSEVTEVPHPDGNGLVGLQVNGLYKSLTPEGFWNPDTSNLGAWEAFLPDGNRYLASRAYEGQPFKTHVIARQENAS